MKTSANLDAERAVLSALVQDVDPVPAFAQLTPKDFFDTFHQRLFAHFKSTIEHGHPLNHTDIVDEMKLQGMEVARLAEMSNPLMVVRKPGELARLVRIVKRDSVGRDLKKTCGEMVEANGDATGLIANLQAKVQNYIESLRETIEPPGILASTVVPKKVKWLWRGRIPLGKITMFDGDPDNGKSAISVDLVARITSGKPMPDDSPCPEGGAVIISNEDDDEDTIVPRLLRAGANMKRVRLLRDIESPEGKRQLEIPLDIPAIRQAALSVNAKIIVFDPLFAFVPTKTNTWSDQHIRRALAPLAELARELECAVLIIRHLNKSSDPNPLHRGGGSIGIIGQARSGMIVGPDPGDESGELRVLAMTKHNLWKKMPALRYRIDAVDEQIAVKWLGECDIRASALLAAPEGEERSAVDEAKAFLRTYLQGGAVPADQILKAAKAAVISEKTLRRAKVLVGVEDYGTGFGKEHKHFWKLPDAGAAR